jgi:hypothetical protein
VSIYALALGGRLLELATSRLAGLEYSKEFKTAVDSALGIQGFALLCTAIYQSFRHQLTLFHAICVIHLLALLGINVISQGQYRGLGPIRATALLAITAVAGCAFIAFNAYVWATAPTFGSQPECNDTTTYVVFGVSISATAPVFRWIIIATLSTIPVAILVFVSCFLPCLACFWCHSRRLPEAWHTTRYSDGPASAEDSRPMKEVASTIGFMMFSIYCIVCLELTISRNSLDPSEKDWTFGQILAVFLLIVVANELLNLCLASLDDLNGRRSEHQVAITQVDNT